MRVAVVSGLIHHTGHALEAHAMTATYTYDIFSTLDGFGSFSGGKLGRLLGQTGPRAA